MGPGTLREGPRPPACNDGADLQRVQRGREADGRKPVRRFDAEDHLPDRCPGAALGTTAQAADLQFDGRHARAEAAANGSFVLHAPKGAVQIAAAPMRSQTGSVMFDALFALAQQEMDQTVWTRFAIPRSTKAGRCRASASRPARAGPMCGPAMSASPPIWRWRGWTRSAPGSRCSSSCRRRATGTRPACSWRRTPVPAAAGRSAATAWCGSWRHATCWRTERLPIRSGRRCRARWRRTARWCSTRRWACTAARPRSGLARADLSGLDPRGRALHR